MVSLRCSGMDVDKLMQFLELKWKPGLLNTRRRTRSSRGLEVPNPVCMEDAACGHADPASGRICMQRICARHTFSQTCAQV